MSNSKKHVLVISSNFSPEQTGISVYSTDLALEVLPSEFSVTVLTGLPHYPWWKTPEKYEHLSPGRSILDKFELIRVAHFVPENSGAIGRARFEYSFWRSGKKSLKKMNIKDYDLVIAIMPTVASGILARSLARKLGIPGIVIFQDVSSLGALQSGMPGAPLLYRVARFLEIRASRWATKIIAVSGEMAIAVADMLEASTPIEVIYNYSVLKASSRSHGEAKRSLEIYDNKYLVLHTGNIGYKQDLLNVVEAASILEKHPEVQILIIGHGNQESAIREAILNRPNIALIPFVTLEDYPIYLVSADVLLINERATIREMSLPSKLTSYLASGRPVIAAVALEGATSKFLKDSAEVVEAGNPEALADAILKLMADVSLQEQLSAKGKNFADSNLSALAGREKYLKLVQDLFNQNSKR